MKNLLEFLNGRYDLLGLLGCLLIACAGKHRAERGHDPNFLYVLAIILALLVIR